MYILGIESSCDDTSVALIKGSDAGIEVLAEKTASQIDVHKKYGGVVPEIAGRKHAEKILPVIEEVLKDQPKPDAIAVTSGPGLMTGLLVGVEVAKTLSYLWKIPIVRTNHIEGHIYSVLLSGEAKNNSQKTTLCFPAVCLIVSGGHTELILMKDHGIYELIGKTRDDAAGEAFDKVAKLLDLPYPGGPKISQRGESGNSSAIRFPRPMMDDESFDMSFSGLKTSALYWLSDNNVIPNQKQGISMLLLRLLPNKIFRFAWNDISIHDFCASFEQAVVDLLISKTLRAVQQHDPKTVILAGGVSANARLRNTLAQSLATMNCELKTPKLEYCMDNATMIATAGYYHAKNEDYTSWEDMEANPNWEIYM